MTPNANALVKLSFCLAILALLPLNPSLLYADSDEVEQIRNAIKAKGAKWHADETSVSKLTEKEKKMRFGQDSESEQSRHKIALPFDC